jgi:hypothetical protein
MPRRGSMTHSPLPKTPASVYGRRTRRCVHVMRGSPQPARERQSWSVSATPARANARTQGPSPPSQKCVAPRTRGWSRLHVDTHRSTSHGRVNRPPADASPSRHARRRVAPPVHEPRWCRCDRREPGRHSWSHPRAETERKERGDNRIHHCKLLSEAPGICEGAIKLK